MRSRSDCSCVSSSASTSSWRAASRSERKATVSAATVLAFNAAREGSRSVAVIDTVPTFRLVLTSMSRPSRSGFTAGPIAAAARSSTSVSFAQRATISGFAAALLLESPVSSTSSTWVAS